MRVEVNSSRRRRKRRRGRERERKGEGEGREGRKGRREGVRERGRGLQEAETAKTSQPEGLGGKSERVAAVKGDSSGLLLPRFQILRVPPRELFGHRF